jgi:hypothetical protein
VTTGEIFLIVALKSALVVVLHKLGFWPDWEQRAKDRADEKLVLRAYKQWRKDAGPEAAAKLRVTLERATRHTKGIGSVKK